MAEYTLTYDFGTGSVKAALVARDYSIRASAVAAYPAYYPQPDWVEQRPEDYWDAFLKVTHELLSVPGVDADSIRGLVFSQTSAAIIFVDKDGNSLYNCVTWVDGRAVLEAEILNDIIVRQMPAGMPLVHEKSVSPKLLWFVRNKPEIVENAYAMLDPAGYLYMKLTGELAYEYTGANATRLFDKMSGKWVEKWFDLLGFPRRLVPDRVVNSSEIVGVVTQHAAEESGLKPGTPVIAGCSDNANGQLGSGCIRTGDVHMYMGSSGWLSVTTTLQPYLMPSAVPKMGFHYYCTDSAGTSVDWLIGRFYAKEKQELGSGVYALMGSEIEASTGQENIIFTPWLYGEEAPVMDADVRGSILNLKPTTTRGDIARAVAEGIGFNFRWIRELYELENGPMSDDITVIGGVGQTTAILQAIANVMNVRLTPIKSYRFAGNIGLAACVDVALGDLHDFSRIHETCASSLCFFFFRFRFCAIVPEATSVISWVIAACRTRLYWTDS